MSLARCAVLGLFLPALFVACGTSSSSSPSSKDASTPADGDAGDSASNVPPSLDATSPMDASGDDPSDGSTLAIDTGDASMTDAGDADADAALPLSRPFALTGIIGTGQSLSVGAEATVYLSTAQPYNNVRLYDDGSVPHYDNDGDVLSLVPLITPIRPTAERLNTKPAPQYPSNIAGETVHESLANEITALSMAADGHDYRIAASVVGESGQPMTVIDKDSDSGDSYVSSLYEARATKSIAGDAGLSFGYGAVFLTHGESDSSNGHYEADVLLLAQNYDADLRALTGQSQHVPLFLTQQGSFPASSTVTSASTLAQWLVGKDNPSTVICVGPKYQYEYFTDHVHMPAAGYLAVGEKYAQAYFQTVVQRTAWRPLQPTGIDRAGAVLTVHMDIPSPPLAWDPQAWPWAFDPTPQTGGDHTSAHTGWANGKGFEVSDSTGELTIASVAINGRDVVITLAAAPTGTNVVVGYAMHQDAPSTYGGGLSTGRHGALRDSDSFVGRDAETIAVNVTSGSATISATTPNGFGARTLHDRVTGDSFAADTVVLSRPAVDAGEGQLVLSSPWTGTTGTATLKFAHEQRNYLVQFSLASP